MYAVVLYHHHRQHSLISTGNSSRQLRFCYAFCLVLFILLFYSMSSNQPFYLWVRVCGHYTHTNDLRRDICILINMFSIFMINRKSTHYNTIFYNCPVRIFQYLSESIGIYCHIAINVVVDIVAKDIWLGAKDALQMEEPNFMPYAMCYSNKRKSASV